MTNEQGIDWFQRWSKQRERLDRLDNQLMRARAALRELVRLKDLHDACEDQTYWATRAVSRETLDQLKAWEADYAQNKPLAWAAAREVLSGDSPPVVEPGADEVVPHGVIYDKLGWLCSQCGGWNHARDAHCTHTHPANGPAVKSGCEWCSAPTHGTARCPWEANGIRCSAGSRHQSVYNEERARFDCSPCGSWARFSERTSGE